MSNCKAMLDATGSPAAPAGNCDAGLTFDISLCLSRGTQGESCPSYHVCARAQAIEAGQLPAPADIEDEEAADTEYSVRDEGGARTTVRASSMEDALELACDWARDGDYGDRYKTVKGDVWVTGPDGEEDQASWSIDPEEPKCDGDLTTYHEVAITPCAAGFGEWDVGEANGDPYSDRHDLLGAIQDNIGETWNLANTPDDSLPEGMQDIRGSIRNQPDYVYGYLDDSDQPHYFGIIESTTPSDGHDWWPDTTGCKENPGVHGIGGAAISIGEHCPHCGWRREAVVGDVNEPGNRNGINYSREGEG